MEKGKTLTREEAVVIRTLYTVRRGKYVVQYSDIMRTTLNFTHHLLSSLNELNLLQLLGQSIINRLQLK